MEIERGALATFVGFVLGLSFAATMGLSMIAILFSDYMQPGRIMADQARQTLILCGIAGFLAAVLAWWMQRFAAARGFVIRFVYGFLIFTLMFLAMGGFIEIARNFITSPGPHDLSPSGIYFASLGGFYTFAFFFLSALRPALIVLLLVAGLVLAAVGPIARDI